MDLLLDTLDPLLVESKFNKVDTVKIIHLYRSHPVLWDIKHTSYRRKDLKIKAYNDIARKMHMTVESVKKKIKSLRSTYTGERRKIILSKSKQDGEEYITSLSWYNEMNFLENIVSLKKPEEFVIEKSSKINTECEIKEKPLETLQITKPKAALTLSTHVLDTSKGKGAAKVPIVLYRLLEDEHWQEMKIAFTDEDGRTEQLLDKKDFQSGIYKLKFDIYKYFIGQGKTCIYPFIEIVVKCVAGQHYHLPLQVSQFSYSTYKGIE